MKKERGITLIALVITIIILIILAGVSINILFDEEGLINKAKKAAEDMEVAQREEEKQLEYIAKQEYGIGSETKQYKRMQMIYDTQEKKTIESNGHINTIIEELNFNLRKDEEDDENS